MSHGVAFAVLCIAIPCLVGGAMYAALSLWDRLRRKRSDGERLPDVNYLI